MSQQRNSRRTNGHPGPHGHPNGHGPAYAEQGGAPAPACASRLRGHAASDDASGLSVASAAAFPAAASLPSQASTGREAYAEVAPPAPNEMVQRMSTTSTASSNKSKPGRQLPPGKHPLPENPAEFVEEIHRKIDLSEVWHSLLRSEDEKVKQRAIEKLTAMLYEDGALSSDDQQIIFDLPRPKRD